MKNIINVFWVHAQRVCLHLCLNLLSAPMLCILNMRDWESRPQTFTQQNHHQQIYPVSSSTHHATACNVSSWSYPFSTTKRMNPACYHCHQKCQSTVKVLMALSFYQLGKLLIYTKYLIAPWVIACEDCRHVDQQNLSFAEEVVLVKWVKVMGCRGVPLTIQHSSNKLPRFLKNQLVIHGPSHQENMEKT